MKTQALVLTLAIVSVLFTGCAATTPIVTTVRADEFICSRPVTVHLVGVTESEYTSYWRDVSMIDYWKSDPPHEIKSRKFAAQSYTKELKFGHATAQCSVRIDRRDPVFVNWQARQIDHMLVLVDMPNWSPDRSGDTDFRRQRFDWPGSPLWSTGGWAKKRPQLITIHIENDIIRHTVDY